MPDMTNSTLRRLLPPIALVLLLAAQGARGQEITDVAEKRRILATLDSLYYSLPRVGFPGFTADAHGHMFDTVAQILRARGADARMLKAFGSLKLSLTVKPDGSGIAKTAKLLPSGNDRFDAGLRTTASGFEMMVNGVLSTWEMFVSGKLFSSPLTAYTITRNQEDGSMTIEVEKARISLDAGMVITKLIAESGGTEVTIAPSFRRTERGLLFERYDGTVGASTSMTLAFTYRQMRGMEILAGIDGEIRGVGGMTSSAGGPDDRQPVTVSFTDIKLMK
jgi:hypothetical protein